MLPRLLSVLILLLVGLVAQNTNAGATVRWQASAGLLPDEVFPSWTLFDSATAEDPVLGPMFLTLETSVNSEFMWYQISEPDIGAGFPLVINARIRMVSGSSSSPIRQRPTF